MSILEHMGQGQEKNAGAHSAAGKSTAESGSVALFMEAIEQSAKEIAVKLPKGSRVAVVAFESESDNLSNFIMDEFTGALFNHGIDVADRQNLEYLVKELKFQMSGSVRDDEVRRVGNFLGADMVITGQLTNLGATFRYQINAIHLEQATLAGITRISVRNDADMRNMVTTLANQQTKVKTASYGSGGRQTPGASLDCGILFLNRKNYDMAINCFTQTIMQNPDMAVAYFYRAKVHHQLGDFRKMIADYDEAIRLNPNLAEMYFYRALAYSDLNRQHNLGRAALDLTAAIKLNPDYMDAYNLRGRIHSWNGDHDLAIADFSQAIKLNPDNAALYSYRGMAYFKKGDIDRALTDYNEAIKINPDDAGLYSIRIEVYLRRDDLNRAIADYGQLIRLKPNNPDAYNKRGDAHMEKGAVDRAIADYGKAIELYEGNKYSQLDIYIARGNAYREKGDKNRAAADYREAMKIVGTISPRHAQINQLLQAVLQ